MYSHNKNEYKLLKDDGFYYWQCELNGKKHAIRQSYEGTLFVMGCIFETCGEPRIDLFESPILLSEFAQNDVFENVQSNSEIENHVEVQHEIESPKKEQPKADLSSPLTECPFSENKIIATYTWKNDFKCAVKNNSKLLEVATLVKRHHILHDIPKDYDGTVMRMFITIINENELTHNVHYYRMDKKGGHRYLYVDNSTKYDFSIKKHMPLLMKVHNIDYELIYMDGCKLLKN